MSVEASPVVERETVVDAPADEVWEAVTDSDRLEGWLGDEVELDPVPGGELYVRDGAEERRGEVLFVSEGERISFSWAREGGEPTFVELEVVALPADQTLVRVIETAPDWAPTALAGAATWSFALGTLGIGCALTRI
jgi:uncharacterized protein YndB with AHSA1/START domain